MVHTRHVALGLLAVALGSWPGTVSAGQNEVFGVTPYPERAGTISRRTFEVPLRAGTKEAVRIYNRTAGRIALYVYAAEAGIQQDGVVNVGFRGRRPAGLAGRIDLARSEVKLAPMAETVVPFTVRGPASFGELAAVVVEETPHAGGSGLDVVQRVAILVEPVRGAVSRGGPPAPSRFPAWVAVGIGLLALAGVLARTRPRRSARPAPDRAEPAPSEPPPPEPALVMAGDSRPAQVERTPGVKPRPRKPRSRKLNYIPLD